MLHHKFRNFIARPCTAAPNYVLDHQLSVASPYYVTVIQCHSLIHNRKHTFWNSESAVLLLICSAVCMQMSNIANNSSGYDSMELKLLLTYRSKFMQEKLINMRINFSYPLNNKLKWLDKNQ
jgi:hypothetical protein